MKDKDIIKKLLKQGWKILIPNTKQDDYDFYIYKIFEISQANELSNYTDYQPTPDEKIYLVYEIYPNRMITKWTIWREKDDPEFIVWDYDDFETVIELALEDRLFTYPQQGCKTCKHNRPRTLKDKTCQKGHKAVFGPYKNYEQKGE